MNVLVTPALPMSPEERERLGTYHRLLELSDERFPLDEIPHSFHEDEVEGIICNFFFKKNDLDVFPNLKFIQLTSAGLDRVPLEQIRERGIRLYNAGDVYAVPMAEWVMARLLEVYKNTRYFRECQMARVWEKDRTLRELSGRKALIFGCGNFGRALAKRLKAFDVHVTAADIRPVTDGNVDRMMSVAEALQVLPETDIAVLALPHTKETEHFAGRAFFESMKDGAVLVNAARGALVDEAALLEAVRGGKLLAALLDVFEKEPLDPESPLWGEERILISPHNAFVGEGNHRRLFEQICKNLEKEGSVNSN